MKKVRTFIIIICILFNLSQFLYSQEETSTPPQNTNTQNATQEQQNPTQENQSDDQDEEDENRIKMSFGGSIDTRVYLTHQKIDSKMTIGSFNEIRLNADIKYKDLFRVYVQPLFLGYYGNRNNVLLLTRYGILTSDQISTSNNMQTLGLDKNETVILDQGWGQISTSWLNIRVGKQIIAWARAYSFNPTDKVNFADVLDPTALNRGIMGTSYEIKIIDDVDNNRSLFLIGYFILKEKEAKDTPFGLKAKFNLGDFECALSYLYEVKDDPTSITGKQRKSHIGLDFFIQFLDISFYFEGTYRLEKKEDAKFDKQLIGVVGFSTTFSFKVSMRIEYIRYGPGSSRTEGYNLIPLFSGIAPFLARDYLFVMFDGDASRIFWLGISGLFNLNDSSICLIPQIKITPIENVKIEIGVYLFFGTQGSEYYGRFISLNQATMSYHVVDIAETQAYLKIKISF